MKTLCLIRHAKSSWEDPMLDDIDRPLNDRGQSDALKMSAFLSEKKIKFDAIISSHALRALDTANFFARALGFHEDDIVVKRSLYESKIKDYLNVIQQLRETYEKVIIIGHNPTMTDLVNLLTNSRIDNIPTCAISIIEVDAESWKDVNNMNCRLKEFIYPKQLKK